jgi:hypothetical protein
MLTIFSQVRQELHDGSDQTILRLLVGLLLPPVLLLSFSIDITRQCGIIRLGLLKFFLDRSQFIFNLSI